MLDLDNREKYSAKYRELTENKFLIYLDHLNSEQNAVKEQRELLWQNRQLMKEYISQSLLMEYELYEGAKIEFEKKVGKSFVDKDIWDEFIYNEIHNEGGLQFFFN